MLSKEITVKPKHLDDPKNELDYRYYVIHNSNTRNKSLHFYNDLGDTRLITDFFFPPKDKFFPERSQTVEVGGNFTSGTGTHISTEHYVRIKGRVEIRGDFTVSGDLVVDGHISVLGNLTVNNLICLSGVSVSGSVHASGYILAKGDIHCSGDFEVDQWLKAYTVYVPADKLLKVGNKMPTWATEEQLRQALARQAP